MIPLTDELIIPSIAFLTPPSTFIPNHPKILSAIHPSGAVIIQKKSFIA
jgi:hypothetical protein